ncbi:MAG: hypothetical protein Q7S23_02945 [bacterium]|nr:hypothetical protein [bacterium]
MDVSPDIDTAAGAGPPPTNGTSVEGILVIEETITVVETVP